MNAEIRELPTWALSSLSDIDSVLNTLPVDELLKLYNDRKIMIFVDRGFALQAAASGVQTSGLTILLSFIFPALLLSAPVFWYFFSWMEAVGALLLGSFAFRASRAGVVSGVRKQALINPKLLDLLISKGTIWFECTTNSSLTVAELERFTKTESPAEHERETTHRNENSKIVDEAAATPASEPRQPKQMTPLEYAEHLAGEPLTEGPFQKPEAQEKPSSQSRSPIKKLEKSYCKVSDAPEGVLSLLLTDADENDEDTDLDRWDAQEKEIDRLPVGAFEVGNFDDEISHSPGLSWLIDKTLFVVPISEDQGTYALLVLDWDDNWGAWDWEAHLVAKGAASAEEAKHALLNRYVDENIIDAEDAYRDFLESLVE